MIDLQIVDDAFTAELQNAVSVARSNQKWEIEYMEWLANEMDREIEREALIRELKVHKYSFEMRQKIGFDEYN